MLRCFVLCIAGAVVVAIRMRFKVNTILHNYMLLSLFSGTDPNWERSTDARVYKGGWEWGKYGKCGRMNASFDGDKHRRSLCILDCVLGVFHVL